MAKREFMTKDVKVTIYGAVWCGPCHGLKNYLKGKKIEYNYIDVDEDRDAGREIQAKTGWSAIPVTQIGEEYILGFDRERVDQALRHHKLI